MLASLRTFSESTVSRDGVGAAQGMVRRASTAAHGVEQVSARSDGHERPPQGWPYARHVANASPSPTPNPDAMKFTLDITLSETLDVPSPDAAVGVPFAEAVFAAGGVTAIFGVNDFITVRRQPGVQWDPIVAAVVAAAAAHL